ncbi:hypothetical protein MNB_ARC-1_567 [hydrothermal vent metagenome]|uniref:Uncharacterized protein n=1 Tax=hydrothermal vent metagenome TaxID=652676 RepID=A0A3B1E1Y4_9ZZZZ
MNPISGTIGLILILASVAVVILSTDQDTYVNKTNAVVLKYIQQSKNALDNNNTNDAIKYSKLAIIANPKDKNGFKAYETAIKLKYSYTGDKNRHNIKNKKVQPSDKESEDGEIDMGC